MYTVKRIDTNEYLTTVSAYGIIEWSKDINESVLFKRKSTAESRKQEDVECTVVEVKFFEVSK